MRFLWGNIDYPFYLFNDDKTKILWGFFSQQKLRHFTQIIRVTGFQNWHAKNKEIKKLLIHNTYEYLLKCTVFINASGFKTGYAAHAHGQTRKLAPLPSARGISISVVFPPIPASDSEYRCLPALLHPLAAVLRGVATCSQGVFTGSRFSPSRLAKTEPEIYRYVLANKLLTSDSSLWTKSCARN